MKIVWGLEQDVWLDKLIENWELVIQTMWQVKDEVEFPFYSFYLCGFRSTICKGKFVYAIVRIPKFKLETERFCSVTCHVEKN